MKLKEILASFIELTPKQVMAIILKMGNSEDFEHREFETEFFGLKYFGDTRNLIDRQIFFLGSYEPGILRLSESILSKSEQSIFVDIGANVGVHSLHASLFAKEVFAIEPYLPVRTILEKKLALNNIHNVHVFPWALGSENKKALFYPPSDENLGTGSLIKNFHHANKSAGELVEVLNSSEAFEKHFSGKKISLIKIDVEGSEFQIFTGLLDYLTLNRPIIIFEYSEVNFQNFSTDNPVTMFLNQNYDLNAIKAESTLNFTTEKWTPTQFGNVICWPKEKE